MKKRQALFVILIVILIIISFSFYFSLKSDVLFGPKKTDSLSSDPKQSIPYKEEGKQYSEKSDGYIIKLKEKSLSEIYAENKDSSSLATSLDEQKNKITNERDIFKSDLNKIAPDGKVISETKNVLNSITVNGLTDKQVEELKTLNEVESITPNYRFKLLLSESVPLINADEVWRLNALGKPCIAILYYNNSPTNTTPNSTAYNYECLTGRGVIIAFIDSGIDYTHKDFGACTLDQIHSGNCKKIIGGYDFGDDDLDPMDEIGHGTHVASIAAGDGVVKGVAPDAKIISYKIIGSGDPNMTAIGENILQAIDRSVDPNDDGNFSDHVGVLSMSVGFNCWPYTRECGPDDVFSQAVDNAVSIGVTAVNAAGNNGGGFTGGEESINTPATARKIITVGSVTKQLDYVVSSSKGPIRWGDTKKEYVLNKPDVVAPGTEICAARAFLYPGASCIDDFHTRQGGTSMAAPHVSGLIALMLQKNPNLKPEEIKSIIKSTTRPLNTSKSLINYQGSGIIDAMNAVFSQYPITLNLEPTERSRGSDEIVIRGKISKENMVSYSLSQSLPHPAEAINEMDKWQPIDAVYDPKIETIEGKIKFIGSKKRVIRLSAINVLGKEFVDYGYVYFEGCGNKICDRGENFNSCPEDCIIRVCTPEELDLIRLNTIERKNLQNQSPLYKIYQDCDIDFSSYDFKDYFEPIPIYYGTYYWGKSHKIKNVIYQTNDNSASLFSLKKDQGFPTLEETYIAGIGIENVTFRSATRCGGLFDSLFGGENISIKVIYLKEGSVNCSSAGGLIGSIKGENPDNAQIKISYVYSNLPIAGTTTGGLIGYVEEVNISVFSSYWDNQTSGQLTSAGGGEGRTTYEMTSVPRPVNTYVDWDFNAVWNQTDGDYPWLMPW